MQQVNFKIFKNIQVDELEAKLNEITKSGFNVVQVLPISKQAYANSFETTMTVVAIDGQPWIPQTEVPVEVKQEEKVS